ncbi:MAG: hypothetical protein AAF447_07730 [Myxococcota bacterium]
MAASHAGPMRPLARARRGGLRRAGAHLVLDRVAVELIFALAERMSEGTLREDGPGGPRYDGSTMLTVDLERLAPHWREALDGAGRERLIRAAEGSVRLRLRAMRLARADVAHRLPGCALGPVVAATSVRIVDAQLHLDVDLEVPLRLSSRSSFG